MKRIPLAARAVQINGTKQLLASFALVATLVASQQSLIAAGPAPVNLGSDTSFAILAGAAITTTGGGTVNGNAGASPIAGSAIHLTEAQVIGTIFAVDSSGPAGSEMDPTLLTTAKGDLTAAYNDAAGRTPIPTGPYLNPGGGNIGGLNLVPGLYKFTSTAMITGEDVTLTGGASDVWIFQIDKDLEVGSGIHVILAGGAQAGNVFWQVGTSATIKTFASFEGTILASQAITLETSSTMTGGALAFTAGVTFDGSSITRPALVAPVGQGSLQVTIVPAGAIDLGAEWMDDSSTNQFMTGATVTGLSAGSHTVSFTTVAGWNTPSNQTVTIINGFTTTVSGLYTLSATPSDALILLTNGFGTIRHGTWPTHLLIGKSYTVTAVPAAKNVFTGWVGGSTQPYPLLSTSVNYTFTMESNLVLEANFVTNLFLPFKGVYNGLFATTSGVTEQTAGMLKGLAVGTNGNYSGTVLINGGSHAISGSFDLTGQAVHYILRTPSHGGPLTVVMTLNGSESPMQVTGTISGTSDGVSWVAALLADLATNSLPSAEYTMLVPPDVNNAPPQSSPGGDGYALITNHPGTARDPSAATTRITGALADGTAFNQTVPVSQDGYVPIYVNLYGGKGLLLGWMNLNSTRLAGSMTWICPQKVSGLYPDGFTNIIAGRQILLSPWTNPPSSIRGATNLSFLDNIYDTNTLMDFTLTISQNFMLGEAFDPTLLTGSINPKTGLLTVTIGNSTTQSILTGHGAMMLNETNGGGYFLTSKNAQAIKIEP